MTDLLDHKKYQLSEDMKKALELRRLNYNYVEIAEQMGKSYLAIRKLIYRADRKIKFKNIQQQILTV
ncbi:MAG: sigma factor-like helix-turn-helix DNA-binding protein [Melioribacteraceae bacterium]